MDATSCKSLIIGDLRLICSRQADRRRKGCLDVFDSISGRALGVAECESHRLAGVEPSKLTVPKAWAQRFKERG